MEKNLKEKKEILKKNLEKWNLNLNYLTVLTEAASGNFIFTPIIAAMAGAEVYAFTKDSYYGKALTIEKRTLSLAKSLDVSKKIKIFKNYLPSKIITKADIITNLGFLRPINKNFISQIKRTAAISLMWETWEFRERDLDLKFCWQKGIPVLGTNENHPRLKILNCLSDLLLNKIFETGIKKIVGLKIVILAEDSFGIYLEKGLRRAGAKVFRKINEIKDAKILVVAFHKVSKVVIGKGGIITAVKLKKIAPNVLIVQLSGSGMISRKDLDKVGIPYSPKKPVKCHHMSWTLNDLVFSPLIELHTAGLKVGEVLARARIKVLSKKEAEEEAIKKSPAQDFNKKQKDQYSVK